MQLYYGPVIVIVLPVECRRWPVEKWPVIVPAPSIGQSSASDCLACFDSLSPH